MKEPKISKIRLSEITDSTVASTIYSEILNTRIQLMHSDYPDERDLHELLALGEVQRTVIGWYNQNGKMVAFSMLDPYNNLLFECLEDELFQSLFFDAVAEAENDLKLKNQKISEKPTLDGSCRAGDTQRKTAFLKAGFMRDENESVFFMRNLTSELPLATLPEKYCIRPLNGDGELNDYIKLHQIVFNSQQMTYEYRKAIMSAPEYDPSLDLVIVAPDGQLVGFCVGQPSPKGDDGWTDPVGVHPDYRNRGLAKALIVFTMREMKARGLGFAKLGTLSNNFFMIALAKSVGFYETERKIWFSKKLVNDQ